MLRSNSWSATTHWRSDLASAGPYSRINPPIREFYPPAAGSRQGLKSATTSIMTFVRGE